MVKPVPLSFFYLLYEIGYILAAPIGNFEGSSISSLRPRRGGAGGGWPLPSSSTSGGGGPALLPPQAPWQWMWTRGPPRGCFAPFVGALVLTAPERRDGSAPPQCKAISMPTLLGHLVVRCLQNGSRPTRASGAQCAG